jgi:hypothetical protein
MEPGGRACGEDRGDKECGEVQHGDHEKPPALQNMRWHPKDQLHAIENKGFILTVGGAIRGLQNTPWLV